MKFCVLALDYDGTIAQDGILHPDNCAAIEEVRALGITVILVTGRILSELKNLAGDLRLFDAIVAENGAVLAFPNSDRSTVLAQPPNQAFFQELDRLGIKVKRGECVVEADADAASQILPVIRKLEMPLAMIFNRGRLMILPQSVSKATGLREALTALRLSEHNAIAIGDAENDHQLLETCEIGMAVGWGSKALQAVADVVIEGDGPSAVADYIRRYAKKPKLTPQYSGRRLLLGFDENGKPFEIDVRGRNLLIAGDSQTGKSWVAGLLCEQLILHRYCVCVIDPEGDYRTLEALPRVVVLGGNDPPPEIPELTRTLRYPDISVVIDLSKMRAKDKHDYVSLLLLMLARLRRDVGIPHWIVVDEAHYFMNSPDVTRLLDLELSGYTAITYQISNLHPDVLASSEAIIVTRETDPREARALHALVGGEETEAEWEAMLATLPLNEAVLLPNAKEAFGKLCRFRLAPRLTSHVRHRNKYFDVPVPDHEAFVFTRDGTPTGRRARTLKELISSLAVTPAESIEGHLRNRDFSRWIADVFRDRTMALQVREIEDQHCFRRIPNVSYALITLIQERYRMPPAL